LASIRLSRRAREEALRRIEESARTLEDFQEVVAQHDILDANRERKERDHEVGRFESMYQITVQNDENDYPVTLSYSDGAVIPIPILHPYWRELMRGDFINYIFDNAEEMWQIIGDRQIASLFQRLTKKQREAVFLRFVRLCSTEQIGCYTDKTDRSVRKLLAAAPERMRKPLAGHIRERLENDLPITLEKRRFLEWYNAQKQLPDTKSNSETEDSDNEGD
jgi:DNA-directed RNA polymerase specialized sigma24 family protein